MHRVPFSSAPLLLVLRSAMLAARSGRATSRSRNAASADCRAERHQHVKLSQQSPRSCPAVPVSCMLPFQVLAHHLGVTRGAVQGRIDQQYLPALREIPRVVSGILDATIARLATKLPLCAAEERGRNAAALNRTRAFHLIDLGQSCLSRSIRWMTAKATAVLMLNRSMPSADSSAPNMRHPGISVIPDAPRAVIESTEKSMTSQVASEVVVEIWYPQGCRRRGHRIGGLGHRLIMQQPDADCGELDEG